MDALKVYKAVRKFVHNHDHRLENVFVHRWEADSFSVTSSAYAYEIEVKVSRSDFQADFKKPKHHLFKSFKKGYGILAGDAGWIENNEWNCKHEGLHPDLAGYRVYWTNIMALKLDGSTCPNKFFYAVPVGLIEAHEIPEYAGLIYVMDNGEPRVIKKAPWLHREPIDVKKMLFDKYYYLSIEQMNRIRALEWQVEDLKGRMAKIAV